MSQDFRKFVYRTREEFNAFCDRVRYSYHFGNGKRYIRLGFILVLAVAFGILLNRYSAPMRSPKSQYQSQLIETKKKNAFTSDSTGQALHVQKGALTRAPGTIGATPERKSIGSTKSSLRTSGRQPQQTVRDRDMLADHYKKVYGDDYLKVIKMDMIRSKRSMNTKDYRESWGGFRDLEVDIRDKDEREKLIEEINEEGWEY